jgi:heme-degrading monooxygenase HmoA
LRPFARRHSETLGQASLGTSYRAVSLALALAAMAHRGLCHDRRVITELAILDVKPGQEAEFEAAFSQAKELIASMKGFEELDLERCLEQPNRYMLRVRWQTLEDHTEGFRGSQEYSEWRTLLHHFYEPFPSVEHYSPVVRVEHSPD